MLLKFFESLYQKVFVSIISRENSIDVYIELYSRDDVVDYMRNNFPTSHINAEILGFIIKYTRETPFSYISVLDTSPFQGALPTCEANMLSFYHDGNQSQYMCHDEKWTSYTSKLDLADTKKRYESTGLDFIFSPFTLLANFFQEKIRDDFALFILIEDTSISLSVFDQSELLFAQYLCMKNNDEVNDLFLDDTLEVLDLEAEIYQIKETFFEDETENFHEDNQRFLLIQNSIKDFYKDEKYKSKFIENIYIADSVGISSRLRDSLEEEMFLTPFVMDIELGEEITKLARMELGL